MKRLIFSLLAIFCLSIFSINSQELRMPKYKFLDNWSVSAAIGTNATFSDFSKDISGKIFAPEAFVSLNKEITPVLGTRIIIGWGQNKINTFENCGGTKSWLQEMTLNPNRLEAGIDFTINPLNLFSYNYDRNFNVLAIVGLGYSHLFEKNFSDEQLLDAQFVNADGLKKGNYIVPKLGLQLNYRVSDPVLIFIEGDFKVYNDKLDEIVNKAQYDGNVMLTAGITYRFKNHDGTRGFNYIPSYNQEDIDALNDKINEQRELIEELKVSPKQIIEVRTKEIIKNKINPTTISFVINSSNVDSKQKANIENIATFLKENEDVNVSIFGYADKETGTAEYNKELSIDRANSVADILVNQYGISKDRLKIEGLGDTVQKYKENDWNRAVIIVQE